MSRSRARTHLLLLIATFATMTVAGAISLPAEGSFSERLIWPGMAYALCLTAILGAHELGHWYACRHYGIPASLPYFIPGLPILVGTFGAVIRIRSRIARPRVLFDVAAAGPIAGFVVALPIALYGVLTAQSYDPDALGSAEMIAVGRPPLFEWLFAAVRSETMGGSFYANPFYWAAWVGMLVTSLNLFPVGQLDGGHVLYAFSARLHRIVSWITILALSTWVAYQLAQGRPPAYLVWLGLLAWMRDRHPPLDDDAPRPGAVRILVALLLLLIAFVVFMPTPFVIA